MLDRQKEGYEISCFSGEGLLYINDIAFPSEEQESMISKLNTPTIEKPSDLETIQEKLINEVLKPKHYQGINCSYNKRKAN